MKASDRNLQRFQVDVVLGQGAIIVIRCACGHDLERPLDSETCDVEDCPCAGFEVAWSYEESEETARAQ